MTDPRPRWDDGTAPKWSAPVGRASRRRRVLLWTVAGLLALGLATALDWYNAGVWCSPRDMVSVRVSGLPQDAGYICFAAERDGKTAMIPGYGWSDFLAGPPNVTRPGAGIGRNASDQGLFTGLVKWSPLDRLCILRMGDDEIWQMAWIPAAGCLVHAGFWPCAQRSCEVRLPEATAWAPVPMELRDSLKLYRKP